MVGEGVVMAEGLKCVDKEGTGDEWEEVEGVKQGWSEK